MNAEIEEILRQLHELRNYMGPVEILIANLEAQMKKNRADLERRIAELELRLENLAKPIDSRNGKVPETPLNSTRLAPDAPPNGK